MLLSTSLEGWNDRLQRWFQNSGFLLEPAPIVLPRAKRGRIVLRRDVLGCERERAELESGIAGTQKIDQGAIGANAVMLETLQQLVEFKARKIEFADRAGNIPSYILTADEIVAGAMIISIGFDDPTGRVQPFPELQLVVGLDRPDARFESPRARLPGVGSKSYFPRVMHEHCGKFRERGARGWRRGHMPRAKSKIGGKARQERRTGSRLDRARVEPFLDQKSMPQAEHRRRKSCAGQLPRPAQ